RRWVSCGRRFRVRGVRGAVGALGGCSTGARLVATRVRSVSVVSGGRALYSVGHRPCSVVAGTRGTAKTSACSVRPWKLSQEVDDGKGDDPSRNHRSGRDEERRRRRDVEQGQRRSRDAFGLSGQDAGVRSAPPRGRVRGNGQGTLPKR